MSIDLATVIYEGGSPNLASFQETSRIELLFWAGGRINVRHTKTGRWPAVPFQSATQEATLYVLRQLDGRWYGTGGERFRPNQTTKDLGKPTDIAPGWLYDTNRWPIMSRPIAEGEIIGFCMVAGDRRNNSIGPVLERTDIRFAHVSSGAIALIDKPEAGAPMLPPEEAHPPVGTTPGGEAANNPSTGIHALDHLEEILADWMVGIKQQLDRIEKQEYAGEGRIGPFSGTVTLKPRN